MPSNIVFTTVAIGAEYETEPGLTKDIPYLALIMGELWGISCEDFGDYWLWLNGTTLYIYHQAVNQ